MDSYTSLSDVKRNITIDSIIACSGSSQLAHLYTKMFQLLHRDFVKLLPPELVEHLLSFLDTKSLIACCCVSKTWKNTICSSSRLWQQACLRSGLVISRKRVDNMEATFWYTYFLEMNKRLGHMKTYKSFCTRTYDRNLRRITAVHYYGGKIAAASESKVIQIWDCGKDICLRTIKTDSSIASIKFDDTLLVASSFIGHMVSWNIKTGQRLTEFARHCGAVFTFEFSKDLNLIISGSSDRQVKIWSLSSGYCYKTLSDHSCWVLKILLCPYSVENTNKKQGRYFLISSDKQVIVVRLMNFISSDMSSDGLYITTLYSIEHSRPGDVQYFNPGLHFDGQFLYYPKERVDNRGTTKSTSICKWDVKKGCLVSEMDLDLKIRALLGIGKKYFMILTGWQDKTLPNFIVFDRESLERVALWNLPPSFPIGPNCSQLYLGENDWLNGLDGKNDHGVIFTTAINDNCVYVLKWLPRSHKRVA